MLQEVVTWPFKDFINIYKFVLVSYVGSNDFSPEWIGVTGVQIDSRVIYSTGTHFVEYTNAVFPLLPTPNPCFSFFYHEGLR